MRLAHRSGFEFADAACALPVVVDLRLRNPAVPLLGLECFAKAQQIPCSVALGILHRGLFGISEIREMMHRWASLSGALDESTETWSQRPGLLEAETGRKGYWTDRVAVCVAFHLRTRRLLLCETDSNQTYWLDRAQLLHSFPPPLTYTYPDTPSPPLPAASLQPFPRAQP
jgi:hypothetical protein